MRDGEWKKFAREYLDHSVHAFLLVVWAFVTFVSGVVALCAIGATDMKQVHAFTLPILMYAQIILGLVALNIVILMCRNLKETRTLFPGSGRRYR